MQDKEKSPVNAGLFKINCAASPDGDAAFALSC